MPARSYLKCISCNADFDVHDKLYTCARCGDLLDVTYEFAYDRDYLKRTFRERRLSNHPLDRSGVWRFRELLAFYDDPKHIVTMSEGNTPIFLAPRSARYAGIHKLQFKHQGLNPTGSFKDNGMTSGVTQARALSARVVACASTGNTSASMAAYAAQAGLLAAVFIPAGQIAFGKLSQSLDYGAKTLQIDGDFDAAMQLVLELSKETDLYLLNSVNPFRLEGQKAIAIELLEQLDWQPPDHILVPGGNLGNSSAIGKGLKECYDLGLIDRLPKLHVIQAAGANPLAIMYNSKLTTLPKIGTAHTLATAIKIANPVSWKKAVRAIEWCQGSCIDVTEQEIADAKAIIGSDGIGCEPASAVTLAGLKRLVEASIVDKDENVVAILTGSLMKDPDYTVNYHMDKLYEKAIYHTETISAQGHIKASFANKPLQVAADKIAIRKLLGL
ncbi:MAG: threonine synthase [Acidobacteriota bacterium]|nr:threonine synthase [Blastocatellia bacterium]MDW8411488.1 threonine synthase [Acidobacteriota bacterium]